MRKLLITGGAGALLALAGLASWPSMAADHRDSPQATANPMADIDDVFAWTDASAQHLNLVMTLGRAVPADFRFIESVDYVFRISSQGEFGQASPAPSFTDVVCSFTAAQVATCEVGNVSVTGDASDEQGIADASNQLRVFAGQRNDPFFFNLNGFRATAEAVTMAAPNLQFDDEGCPMLDSGTSNMLVTQLASEPDGSPAVDDFANSNILALVLQVDVGLVNDGGDILGVSGFTYSDN